MTASDPAAWRDDPYWSEPYVPPPEFYRDTVADARLALELLGEIATDEDWRRLAMIEMWAAGELRVQRQPRREPSPSKEAHRKQGENDTVHKVMRHISVSTSEGGEITLIQASQDPEDADQIIHINPDQVELLVRWLEEAKGEILREEL